MVIYDPQPLLALVNRPQSVYLRYVLRPTDSDPATVRLHTNSAVRLCPEDPEDPLCGMDSVRHMLNQIEFAQQHDLPRQGP
jgi:hypothetical protein